ncbi:MAG: hypothetical protein K6F46_02035 [Desulfovibrio sp.]|nr:hypothetical protein [Desulfovibrio sp.]
MRVLAWGDNEKERVFLDESKWEFARFPHQGLALYRPSKSAPVRFFAQVNVFEGKEQKNPANAFNLNLLEWRRESKNMAKLATWQLFDPAISAGCSMNASSPRMAASLSADPGALATKSGFLAS